MMFRSNIKSILFVFLTLLYSCEVFAEVPVIQSLKSIGAGSAMKVRFASDGRVWLVASSSAPYSFYPNIPKDIAKMGLSQYTSADATAKLVSFINLQVESDEKIKMGISAGTVPTLDVSQRISLKTSGYIKGVTTLKVDSTDTMVISYVGVLYND